MKNFIWKHRIVLGLLVILLVQVPFIVLKLTTPAGNALYALVEIAHVLLTSGLAGYLFSKTFDSLLENSLYGALRRNWNEVRVMYSDGIGKGMGDAYPREPTLLIQAPPFADPERDGRGRTPGDLLVAQGLDGSSHTITAQFTHSPMSISFNNAYVGQPAADETTYATGKWSELQLMRVGPPGHYPTLAGFPDTLVTLGSAPTASSKA